MDRIINEHDLITAFEDGYQAGVKAAQPKWISVKERMPDEGQMVLAYTHYFYEVLQWYEKSKQWIATYGWYSQEHVTHWMPLPV